MKEVCKLIQVPVETERKLFEILDIVDSDFPGQIIQDSFQVFIFPCSPSGIIEYVRRMEMRDLLPSRSVNIYEMNLVLMNLDLRLFIRQTSLLKNKVLCHWVKSHFK